MNEKIVVPTEEKKYRFILLELTIWGEKIDPSTVKVAIQPTELEPFWIVVFKNGDQFNGTGNIGIKFNISSKKDIPEERKEGSYDA